MAVPAKQDRVVPAQEIISTMNPVKIYSRLKSMGQDFKKTITSCRSCSMLYVVPLRMRRWQFRIF